MLIIADEIHGDLILPGHAFTPYATCPLPPPQNRLAVRIEAGERKYGH